MQITEDHREKIGWLREDAVGDLEKWSALGMPYVPRLRPYLDFDSFRIEVDFKIREGEAIRVATLDEVCADPKRVTLSELDLGSHNTLADC